jgi:protein ImuB
MAQREAQQKRRMIAVVLPDLLNELALQRIMPPSLSDARGRSAPSQSISPRNGVSPRSRARERSPAKAPLDKMLVDKMPRAVVLTDAISPAWEAKTQLDAVNSAARQLGVRPRQSIAQATAIVEGLTLHALPSSCVSAALKQVAEVALGFGSPVCFEAPDTVWVDISGSAHLFESERALGLELVAHTRALGYRARVAVANGPWLAQSFARYSVFDETGLFVVNDTDVQRQVGDLPIVALPISRETVTWFSRLGLLNVDDLRKLPRSALAARLDRQMFLPAASVGREYVGIDGVGGPIAGGSVLDLLQGRDDGELIPYQPEGLPFEQVCWDEPLESIEPLLFVLKGLSGRLCARLEGRGQAAQELLLTIRYDRSIAALRVADGEESPACKELMFRLASPLTHAEDVERVVRARLQRESLLAPAVSLGLQALALTETRHWQLNLRSDVGLGTGLSTDPRSVAVLMAELSADIGDDAVGVLVESDSHLMEKSSHLVPAQKPKAQTPGPFAGTHRELAKCRRLAAGAGRADIHQHPISAGAVSARAVPMEALSMGTSSAARLPTRFLSSPIELHAPMKINELWVLNQRPFVIERIQFEQRLEAIEWWEPVRIFRDYFRVWLAAVEGRNTAREGLEVLVYVDRDNGRNYVQALYD